MEKTREQGKQRAVTPGCCGIPLFPRIYSFRSKPASTGGSTGSGKSQPEEDPSSEALRASATTKANVAGRRLRSDSPTEDGALESQPLKRQNSMGEDEPSTITAGGRLGHSSSQPDPRSIPADQEEVQLAVRDASFLKSQTFPPSKSESQHLGTAVREHAPPVTNECPPYGSKSVIGRRAKMEDACVAVPYLMEVPLHKEADELLPPRLAPQLRTSSGSSRGSGEATATTHHITSSSGGATEEQQQQQDLSSTGSGGVGVTSGRQIAGPSITIPSTEEVSQMETLHFFGVFDGHGGADAAMHCAKTLHERLKDVLSAITSPSASGNNDDGAVKGEAPPGVGEEAVNTAATTVEASSNGGNGQQSDANPAVEINSSSSAESDFLDAVDMEEGDVEGEGALGPAASVVGVPCTTETVEAALTKAFHLTDEEFGEMGGYEHLALVGTTAVVALVGSRMIYVANCGDSRAVLCRDGQAVPLTDDHKAAREDETARVEAAGGQILFWNGVRVMGLLAVSRAIGDHSLRPYVIAEPEVTIVNRHGSDELLIMASDGLWDVMSNQEACNLAKKCLLRARQRGSSRQSAARVAATVLTRAAVDRGSRDNVTVVIVDMTASSEDDDVRRLESGASLGNTSNSAAGLERFSSGSGSARPMHHHSSGDATKQGLPPSIAEDPPPATSAPGPSTLPVPSPFESAGDAPLGTRAETFHRTNVAMPSPFSTDD